MIKHTCHIRVRYAETDAMQYVYYGNYAQYFEVARVELFRHLGLSYNEIEQKGILMPVSEHYTKYIFPAQYDDILTIHTQVKELPTAKIIFEYQVFNAQNQKIAEASTTLFFLDKNTKKITRCPDFLMELISLHWKD